MCRRRHSGRRFAFGHHRGLSRVIGKTGTNRHILLYETVIIIGGIFGNVLDIFEFPMLFGARGLGIPILGHLVLGIFGLCSGIFVGCLVMSLAETLKALPVISRRIRLCRGAPVCDFIRCPWKIIRSAWSTFWEAWEADVAYFSKLEILKKDRRRIADGNR